MNQLLFYQNIVALDRIKHSHLKFITPTNFAFAQSFNISPIVLSELDEAVGEFPVVFVPSGKNEFILAALMDLRNGNNTYVKNGKWLGRYIPAFIRRYPFITIPTAEDANQFMVAIDDAAPFLSDSTTNLGPKQEAHNLFDGEEPGKILNSFIPFLQNYHAENLKTVAFCKKIYDLGLIKSSTIKTTGIDGKEYQLQGIGLIDDTALRALSDPSILDLFKTGALMQIYRQQFSLRNCALLSEKLTTAEQRQIPKASPATAVKQPVLAANSKDAAPLTLKASSPSKAASSEAMPKKAPKPLAKASIKPASKSSTKPSAKSSRKK
ncbi:SapC family protein [Polynucleobacter paneuropaeus]|nr:SapC family protein [Polynucleobacter paneuropaeus]